MDTHNVPAPDLTVVRVASFLLRHRRTIVGTAVVAVLGTVVALLMMPATFTSVSAFIPQSRRASSPMSGLAAQLGFALPGAEPNQSPAFYVELIRSTPILTGLLKTPADSLRAGDRVVAGEIVDSSHLRGRTLARKQDAGVRFLRRRVVATTNARTGIVRVSVQLASEDIAAAANERLLTLLNDFNVRSRRSQASAEREFTERRLAEAKSELRDAEDRREAFLQRNRDYHGSPSLQFQNDRLEREIVLRQQVYSSMAQAYEQARIEEIRDTPIITILEQPSVPARPDARGFPLKILVAAIVGLGLGLTVGLVIEAFRGPGPNDRDERAELATLWGGTVAAGVARRLTKRPATSGGAPSSRP